MTRGVESGAPVVTGGAAGRSPCPILFTNDRTTFLLVPAGLLNLPLGRLHLVVSVPCHNVTVCCLARCSIVFLLKGSKFVLFL